MRTRNSMVTGALLCALVLVALPVQATIYWVTNADGGKTTGSFAQVMEDMRYTDGDTLMFDSSLANQTITLTASAITRGGKACNRTLIGNGVKLVLSSSASSSSKIQIGSTTEYFVKLIMENMDFDAPVELSVGKEAYIKNCVFRAGLAKRTITAGAGAKGTNEPHIITFEGCAFLGDASNILRIYSTIRDTDCTVDVRFVSCTFVNNSTSSSYTNGNILYANTGNEAGRTVSFTNCVLTDAAASAANPSVYLHTFTSNGYNVLHGKITTSTTQEETEELKGKLGWTKQATDDLQETIPSINAPLVFNEGIYKVNTDGSAYLRLPANTSVNGISFPEKDLAGTVIDYTAATHSGAWQTTHGTVTPQTPKVESVSILLPSHDVFYTDTTYSLQATVLPNGVEPQGVTWSVSPEQNATVTADGQLTVHTAGEITITATSKATDAQDQQVTDQQAITVSPYRHVTSVSLPSTLSLGLLLENELTATVLPADANNPKLNWSIDHPTVASMTITSNTTAKLKGLTEGTATITVTSEDGNRTASCTVTVGKFRYTDGVFFVNEDWFGWQNSSLNFLTSGGTWIYNTYRTENPGKELGCTSQYGTIYGGRLFIVSKQAQDGGAGTLGSRLAVADAETLKAQAEIPVIAQDEQGVSIADPRAFLGVDESKGYVSTSNGLWIYDIDSKAITGKVGGTESGASLYSGQVCSMLRVGDRVFAIMQGEGILVINATTHMLETKLTGRNYFSLTLDNEGNIWSCVSDKATGNLNDEGTLDVIVKIDPYTLETTTLPVPGGFTGPVSTWAAWQLAPIHASKQDGKLYWVTGVGAWDGKKIIAYDTKNQTAETVFDLTTYDGGNWHAYGGGFGIHPTTNDLYLSIQKGAISNDEWSTLRINPTSKAIAEEYPMNKHHWYVSMPVFPDNHAPVIDASFPATETLNASNTVGRIALRPLVTDADNNDAAIIKTVTAIGNPALVEAIIRHDTLIITPLKDLAAAQTTTVSLKFNSNGKVVTKDVTVTVQPGAIAYPVKGVTLNHATAELTVGTTLPLIATINPANADNKALTWESNQPLVASVDRSGVVTAHLAPSTAVITVTTAEGGFTATCVVSTKAASTPGVEENPFELTQQTLALYPGQTAQLALTAPQHFSTTWRSTNTSVATVTQTGLVTTLAAGTTLIIARDVSKNKADTCTLTVSPLATTPTYTLALNTSTLYLVQGGRSTLQVTVTPQQAGQAPVWSSSNPAVADVTASGTVIGLAPGVAMIQATLGTVSASCIVVVNAQVTQLAVSNLTEDAAQVAFPKVTGATYYLAHLFEVRPTTFYPVLTLKVTPDGRVSLRAAAGDNLVIPLQFLSSGTSYIVRTEAVREISGKAEVIHTEVTSFATLGTPTGIPTAESAPPRVSYAGGTLYMEHLDGYDCMLINLQGQTLERFRITEATERKYISLKPGIYILTATNGYRQETFKIVVSG